MKAEKTAAIGIKTEAITQGFMLKESYTPKVIM